MSCRTCNAGMLLYLLAFVAPSVGAGASESNARPESDPSDWFHVIQLDESTYAISEPRYWLKNVSYLLIGTRSALLFDTGPGVHSIRPVVDRSCRPDRRVSPRCVGLDTSPTPPGHRWNAERVQRTVSAPNEARVSCESLAEFRRDPGLGRSAHHRPRHPWSHT